MVYAKKKSNRKYDVDVYITDDHNDDVANWLITLAFTFHHRSKKKKIRKSVFSYERKKHTHTHTHKPHF